MTSSVVLRMVEMKDKDKRIENLAVLPFYSALPYSEQNKVTSWFVCFFLSLYVWMKVFVFRFGNSPQGHRFFSSNSGKQQMS